MASIESARIRPHPHLALSPNPLRALAGSIGYLGGVAILATAALRAVLRPADDSPPLLRETARQLDRLLKMGFPLVAMVHVGMGSFLAMQAYFGATFVEGIGPVVGVGLVRNLASLLSGFILSGLVAARHVADFRGPAGDDPAHAPRMAASRVAAAMVAGPILAAWGSAVGIVVGWLVAESMMGVTWPAFFDLFIEMLWVRDVVGLVVKGALFGGLAAVVACHEGMRRPDEGDDRPDPIGSAACRAACLAGVAILVLNAGWFLLIYHAGPAFGPTVMDPPTG